MKAEMFSAYPSFKKFCLCQGTAICKDRYLSYKSRCLGPTVNSIAPIIFTNVTISFTSESRSGGISLTKQLVLYEEWRLTFRRNTFYSVMIPNLVEFINILLKNFSSLHYDL